MFIYLFIYLVDNRVGLVVEGGKWLVGMFQWVDMLQFDMLVALEEGMLLADKEQD